MAKRSAPMMTIPEDFVLTEKTVAWVQEKYPTVNIDGTLERFVDSSHAHGRMYADWQAAFKNWVRKAIENKWDGVEYKQGRAQDPRWMPILNEVRPYGFRMPLPHETPGSYRTEFENWKRKQEVGKPVYDRAPVIDFGNLLKKVGS